MHTDAHCSMKDSSMTYSEHVPMSDVCVKQHAGNMQSQSSRANLYDKSLTPTPKECLYFSPAGTSEHQHTRHQLHQQQHHMFEEAARSSLHFHESQAGDRQRDLYAEAPLDAPGPFRVSVAASSSSALRERNYEIPFLVSSKVSFVHPFSPPLSSHVGVHLNLAVITCLSCLIASPSFHFPPSPAPSVGISGPLFHHSSSSGEELPSIS